MGSGSSKSRAKRGPESASGAAPLTAPAPAAIKAPAAAQHNGSSSGKAPAGVATPPAVEPASRVSTSSSAQEPAEPEHKGAEAPLNEPDRMDYLCKLGVLDTEPEKRFDDITRLCCLVFKCPIALVSLVDKDRQWFKSVQGLPVRQTDRRSSFCAWTLLPEHPEVLVVENALEDIRFRNNPLVLGSPHIRFYAGCPLVATQGLRLGSLCIIDNKPRRFDAESCNMLANMAEMVVREIEKDKLIEAQKIKSEMLYRENHQLIRALDCFNEGIMLVNMSLPSWPILFVNEAWEKATGVAREALTGDAFWTSFATGDVSPEASRVKFQAAIDAQESFSIRVFVQPAAASSSSSSGTGANPQDGGSSNGNGNGRRCLSLQFRCAHNSTVDTYMPLVGIPSILSAAPVAGGPMYYFVTLLMGAANGTAAGGTPGSADPASASQRGSAFTIINTKIDPFDDVKLGPLLGKGSYGRVYRGVWNGAQVAVKVLETMAGEGGGGGGGSMLGGGGGSGSLDGGGVSSGTGGGGGGGTGGDGEVLEAVLSASISHPNVVQTYKHCTRRSGSSATDADNEGRPLLETWMVMEFCNKGGLTDAIERGWFRKRHSLFEVDYRALILTAREVAAAMTYLHSRNILHGDLTGTNVLLTASDRDERHFAAKVADFGLSRVLQGEAVTTRSYGTITHMAQELLVDGLLSKAADVYSFGVVVWEMYTGQRPFGGLSHGQILHAITTGKQLPLGPTCPQPMREFLSRCLAPKPEARPSFAEIIDLLEELEQELC
ncbi:hypothetical protein HYH02_001289 [Chlamydomonas schloesseri]|uniref:Protein kinase domain-containing protein n=1 Tax=Chlamydomonas schloesseri TaxID=2026947 RepID=A0A835WV80_9CHLO|nr:hypothetical protein HYH02_001289 [Chlamydomonas schloesseri]|eukprot:KAG2454256.1 hypothetical protein HYH02_001289 [Chlamydomonas schloesseri]